MRNERLIHKLIPFIFAWVSFYIPFVIFGYESESAPIIGLTAVIIYLSTYDK